MPTLTNILYLDDDPDDAAIFKEYITRTFRDVNVHVAYEPMSAPQLYRSFDCFILDYRMGQHDGIEVARIIHTEDWRKPIMLLTGHDFIRMPGAYFVIDHIASKNDPDDVFGKMQAMLRAVAARRP